MNTPDEEETAEICESLRIAAEADIRWSVILSKFTRAQYAPPPVNDVKECRPLNL